MLIIRKPRKKGWRWQNLKEKQNALSSLLKDLNTLKNKVKELTNK